MFRLIDESQYSRIPHPEAISNSQRTPATPGYPHGVSSSRLNSLDSPGKSPSRPAAPTKSEFQIVRLTLTDETSNLKVEWPLLLGLRNARSLPYQNGCPYVHVQQANKLNHESREHKSSQGFYPH